MATPHSEHSSTSGDTLQGESTIPSQQHHYEPKPLKSPDYKPAQQSPRYWDTPDFQEVTRQLSTTLPRTATSLSMLDPENERFDLEKLLQNLLRQADEEGKKKRELGVTFKNLNVYGSGSGVKYGSTVGDILAGPLTVFKKIQASRHAAEKHILQGFSGAVRPGEMLLVIGRPGSGCSTLLKTLANNTASFEKIEGDISYEGISPAELAKHYAGEAAYLPEDDIHLPLLTVDQTLTFAAEARAPAAAARVGGASRSDYVNTIKAVQFAIFGLGHTKNTKVGGDLIRGVSGGERKRVSIAELMTTRAKIACHDNSTRGLDSSTSVEYVRALRIVCDLLKITTIVSIYQAGEQLFTYFSKVCLIYEGRMVYMGPRDQAVEYFKALGYEPQDRQTSADFLAAVTDPKARFVRKGYENRVPKTADEFAKAFLESDLGKANAKEVEETMKTHSAEGVQHIKDSVQAEKVGKRKISNYNISYWQQTKLCFRRRVQLQIADLPTLGLVTGAAIFQSLIIGSVFYNMPETTSGFFSRGGVIFFAILFNALTGMAEINASYAQRPIVVRQRRYAQVHPSCDAVAQTIVDIPVKLVTVFAFDVILYWLTGLQASASQFFVFLLFTGITTLVMIAFFRALAASTRAESTATAAAGLSILVLAIYTGYAISRPSMKVWFRWLSYAHPIGYAFESLISNEFRTLSVPCDGLVPSGPAYAAINIANQACTALGSIPGQALVQGPLYLQANFGYTWDNAWRNFGIIIGFWIFFLAIYIVATEYQEDASQEGAVVIYRQGKAPEGIHEAITPPKNDEESKITGGAPVTDDKQNTNEQEKAARQLEKASDVFTWRNLCYDVMIKKEKRRLLSNVAGYVAPGQLTALMGESGAGKTTLLNCLANRVDTGILTGDMFVNGKPLPKSFQRETGYVQQQDVHLPTATVREALQFSALLRQPKSVPDQEKLDYVETVIHMLEMETFAEAIVGEVGMGLNVEQRKRLTIGVELAAKPKLLLFLDEPSSGLDSQSAWSIIQFLRKLADHGQSIICTIHQPSGELFNVFDRLLLLQKGGKTVYFGDIGDNSKTLIEYFHQRTDLRCDEKDNPAEYILNAIGAGATAKVSQNWHQMWLESPECEQVNREIDEFHHKLKSRESKADTAPDSDRTYAASSWRQFTTVTRRAFIDYWRDPVYIGAKLMLNLAGGLFIGFSFYQWPHTPAGTQVALFSVFMITVLASPLSQQLQPKFLQYRGIYEQRERPSRMFNFFISNLAAILVEIPYNIFCGTVLFFSWYYTVGYPFSSARVIYAWLMYAVVFEIYFSTFAQAIAALAPNAMAASVLFATSFSFVITFNGVLQPPQLMPKFWSSWMYYLSPFTWLISGLLSNGVGGGIAITCPTSQTAQVLNPSATDTCGAFLGNFVSMMGGYIVNPDAVGANTRCGYCRYANGDEFLATVSMSYADRWRNLGIVIAYCFFNIFVVFAFTWLFRVHKWSGQASAIKSTDEKAKEEQGDSPIADSDQDGGAGPMEQIGEKSKERSEQRQQGGKTASGVSAFA